ncbi:MAG: tetratricopeptide repeat protein [Myxococcota bacterium]
MTPRAWGGRCVNAIEGFLSWALPYRGRIALGVTAILSGMLAAVPAQTDARSAPTAAMPHQASHMAIERQQPAPAAARAAWGADPVAFIDRPPTSEGAVTRRKVIAAQMLRLRGPELRQDREARRRAIDSLIEQTTALGDPALMSEAHMALAVWQFHPLEPAEGRATAERGFRIADVAGRHAAAARAASICVALETPGSEGWQRWVRTTELHIALAGGEPTAELQLTQNRAREAAEQERFDEALGHWQRAVELIEQIHGEGHPMLASAVSSLADVFAALDDLQAAEDTKRRALELAGQEEPADLGFLAEMRVDLGKILFRRGHSDAAIAEMEHGVALLGDEPDPDLFLRATQSVVRGQLGHLLQQLGRHHEAIEKFESAVPMLDHKQPNNAVRVYRAVARSRIALGQREEAILALQHGLSYVDPDAPETPERLDARAMLAELQG